ncbi:methionine adenosyltransferase [Candidatus Curtissbacteria bacterium RIFCSPLOWO2_01_FULL_41_18]|uniref:Methionine adenosyltransferase n=2 Tax=Candidatus Curtissiibacteriota TaxID=1752717 RepID=A0A1F5G0B8_9BACT|nr:MAG: methionine adenosyltransferase [Candidatus Curtissbacteria bacterium RIFCSPHIGHO2_01_FULL_41_13]OGE03909.1 MAG: methionine adenosyltransferase [Candidatus Curtissbacteria bacterium RIFCSPLOWO2_01_FULL_41_18]
MNYKIFTSESVCAGHPDKICDQISDAILDAHLADHPQSRVAVETLVTTNKVVIAGEIASKVRADYEKIARNVVKDLGYDNPIYNFRWQTATIEVLIHQQSLDIASGVSRGGAGDQGIMFGYATDETANFMPLPIVLAHEIVKAVDTSRKSEQLPYLRPDGKSQVTVEYKDGYPLRVIKVITAVPHDPKIDQKRVSVDIYEYVIKKVLGKYGYTINFSDTICNGTGKWAVGGPTSDTGVTGRKINVDSYGSAARVGGGCFSGKDPTKVDRSAAYAARFIAKNIVAAKFASRCEIQLAYVIGKPRPIAKAIETFGTQKVAIGKIEKFAWSLIDLSVNGIITHLNLRRPIYQKTASYGHFGREGFSWEKIVS